jgi:putative oxidoreductase
MALLARLEPQVYALFRIVAGFLFFCHGLQKLFGVLGGNKAELVSLIGLAGILEFAGGLLIMFGFYAGYAAFVCSGLMAVAYFKVHAPQGFWPILNKGELAALYSFLFLYIAAKGSGIWSIDGLRRK